MSGVVDPFWLWEHCGLPVQVVLVAAGLTLVVWVCARVRDRLTGATVAAAVAFVLGVWSAAVARKHTRPRGD
jgi:hypothetical protein